MARFIERFTGDDMGNTMIDWMVLTAGLVLLGAAIVATVNPSIGAVASDSTEQPAAVASGV